MPDATVQDVLDFLEEYRTRVDHGRNPDPAWQRRKSEIFTRMAKCFEERGQMAQAQEAAELATAAGRRADEEP